MLSGLSGDRQLWTLGSSHWEGPGHLGLACAWVDGRIHSPSVQCETEDRAPHPSASLCKVLRAICPLTSVPWPHVDGCPVPALFTSCRASFPSPGPSPLLIDHMVLGAPVSGYWLRAAEPHVAVIAITEEDTKVPRGTQQARAEAGLDPALLTLQDGCRARWEWGPITVEGALDTCQISWSWQETACVTTGQQCGQFEEKPLIQIKQSRLASPELWGTLLDLRGGKGGGE